MTFIISDVEQKKIDEWKAALVVVFGSYGDLEYIFKTGSGVGVTVLVKSSLVEKRLDATDYDKW